MKLSKKEIKKIAELARLELTDKELETYGGQLEDILGYVDQLKEVDTSNIQPTAQVTGLENVMREDETEDWPTDEVEASLSQAPKKEDKYIKVKRVLNN